MSTHRVVFIIFKKIENPAAYEMRSVINFLNVRNMKLAEIRQLCDLYGRTFHEYFSGMEMDVTI